MVVVEGDGGRTFGCQKFSSVMISRAYYSQGRRNPSKQFDLELIGQ